MGMRMPAITTISDFQGTNHANETDPILKLLPSLSRAETAKCISLGRQQGFEGIRNLVWMGERDHDSLLAICPGPGNEVRDFIPASLLNLCRTHRTSPYRATGS